MAKKEIYFSHNAKARRDPKIIKLMKKHHAAGYGVYFMLIEMLREEEDYCLGTDYEVLAYELHEDECLVRSVVEEFGLFVVGDGRFHSESLDRRMRMKDAKSQVCREAVNRRWHSSEGNANPPDAAHGQDTNVIQTAYGCNTDVIGENGEVPKSDTDLIRNDTKLKLKDKSSTPDVVEDAATSPPDDKKLRSEVKKMRASPIWVESVLAKYKITEQELDSYFEGFVVQCIVDGKSRHSDLADAKRHFSNWLRIQTENKSKDNGKDRQDTLSLRRASEIPTGSTEADYTGTF